MLKRIIATFLVATALMFSGCGDEAGEDFLEAQHSIDEGDFGAAIALYEDIAPEDRTDAQNVLLANAYMGEAGFSTLDIISKLGEEPPVGEDPLTTFTSLLIDPDADPATTLINLDKAIAALEQVTADGSAGSVEELGDNELTLGLAYMAKVSLLLDDPASSDADIETTINSAFDFISAVGNDEIAADIADMKLETFGATGVITEADIAAYRALL